MYRVVLIVCGILAFHAACGDRGRRVRDYGAIDPLDVPLEVSVDVPLDVPVEAPPDAPADVGRDVPADVLHEVLADVLADTLTDSASDVPADLPGELAVDVPDDVPTDAPGDVCVPESCADLGRECGRWTSRCGTDVDCGGCGASGVCDEPSGTCGKVGVARVPTTDGTATLWTRVFLPPGEAEGGRGALLNRTPYRAPGIYTSFYEGQASFYTQHGVAFVLQDVRGTHDSTGTLYPMRDEVADGQATVAWIRAQPWSNGKVGTLGASYDGYTAIAAGVDTHLDVILADDPCAGIYFWNRGGTLGVGTMWYYLGDLPEDDANLKIAEGTNALILGSLDVALTGQTLPVWQDMLAHPAPADPFWSGMTLEPVLADVCAPMFVANTTGFGWNDGARIANAQWKTGCAEHAADIRLVVGNFGHGATIAGLPYGDATVVSGLFVKFLDKYLGGQAIDLSEVPPIQFYAEGDGQARTAGVWPPATSDTATLHLRSGGTLSAEAPVDEAASHLTVDPGYGDPCNPGNPFNAYQVFLSDPLSQALFVAGMPELTLHASVTGGDADFFVTLLDFDPATQAWSSAGWTMARARYRQGFESPQPTVPGEPFELDLALPAVSWNFRAGHEIGVLVEGAACGLVENPHSGEPVAAQTHRQPSDHSILHTAAHDTRLTLPIFERGPAGAPGRSFARPEDLSGALRAAFEARRDERQRLADAIRAARRSGGDAPGPVFDESAAVPDSRSRSPVRR